LKTFKFFILIAYLFIVLRAGQASATPYLTSDLYANDVLKPTYFILDVNGTQHISAAYAYSNGAVSLMFDMDSKWLAGDNSVRAKAVMGTNESDWSATFTFKAGVTENATLVLDGTILKSQVFPADDYIAPTEFNIVLNSDSYVVPPATVSGGKQLIFETAGKTVQGTNSATVKIVNIWGVSEDSEPLEFILDSVPATTTTTNPGNSPAACEHIAGDLNADGTVTNNEQVSVSRMFLGVDPVNPLADTDNDGVIQIWDLMAASNCYMGNIDCLCLDEPVAP
jgi:hypothetical protein